MDLAALMDTELERIRAATGAAVGGAWLVLVAAVWSLTYGKHLAALPK